LSLGIGSVAICGSYIDKQHSLPKEGLWIIFLDTVVAISAGLIIFPCCATFSVSPDAGPSLIFITLPQVFTKMAGGRIWGSLFFIFLMIAALSTLVAVFENLVAFLIDEYKIERKKSTVICFITVGIMMLPCIMGYNILSNIHPLGGNSTILDFEDFIVSDNLLPLGALTLSIFCTRRYGWGGDNFFEEVNCGKGIKLAKKFVLPYMKWVLPVVIIALWAIGISKKIL
jgi:NSS family neurotransmitter:Na+ symporter